MNLLTGATVKYLILMALLFPFQSWTQTISDLPGLLIWLRADSNVVITAGEVTQWSDISGNNNHFTPVLPSTRPALVSTSALNNEPYVLFDGTKRMQTAGNLSLSNATVIVVAENNTGDPTYGRTIDHTYNFGFWIGRGGGNDAGGGFYEGAPPYGNYMPNNLDQPYVISMVRSGAVTSSYRGSETFPVPSRTTFASPTTPNKVMLGASLLGGDNGNKDIFEVIVFNRALDSQELAFVHEYLRVRYSGNISLGPDINQSNSFCPVALVPSGGFSSFLWSTGSTASSINVTAPGQYWVRGTDALGFYSYDTINVTFPVIPAPVNNAICVGNANNWSADMGIGYTYLWSTGETTPSINITSPGNYSVTVFDGFGCSNNSGNESFAIDLYESTAFLGDDTTLCTGNLLALQVGAFETMEYYWNGDLAIGQLATFAVTTSGQYTIESVNVNGCVAQDTIQITIAGTAPVADFSYTDLCGIEQGTFTDLSIPAGADPISIWAWNMGDGTNFSTQNVNYTYASPGVYTVQLYVESAGGCGAFQTATVNVFDPPVSSFTKVGHCEDQVVNFTSTATAGGSAITGYSWNFDMPSQGAGNVSTLANPSPNFPDPATYDVSLVVTDANGCRDSISVPVVIDPTPIADFTNSLSCFGSSIQLTDQSTTLPGSTYNWSWPAGGSILQNPSVTFSSPGSYSVSLTVGNSFGCSSTETKTITVHPLPTMSLDFGPHCAGTYMEATAITNISSGSIDSVQWTFEATDVLTGTTVDYLIGDLGQLEIEATAYSDQGCTTTVTQNLDITSELDVTFTPLNGVAGAGDLFQFDNTSVGTTVALWNFGDGQFSSNFDATHIYGDQYIDSVMNVYLIGLNIEGCMDTAYGQITVQRPYLDLALEEVFVQADGEWQIVGVRMRNTGSVNVAKAEVWIETLAGRLVQETWTGLLVPDEDSIYIFNGKIQSIASDQDDRDAFVCVGGIGYDLSDGAELDLFNNTACKDVEGDDAVLLPIYPNPAQNDLELQLLISKEESVTLYVTDAIGQIVMNVLADQLLTKGLYTYPLDIRNWRDGVYFVRMRTETQDLSEKVVVR